MSSLGSLGSLGDNSDCLIQTLASYRRGPLLLDRDLFALERKIGSGFFGNCYLASVAASPAHTLMHVAVKMLKEEAVPVTKVSGEANTHFLSLSCCSALPTS